MAWSQSVKAIRGLGIRDQGSGVGDRLRSVAWSVPVGLQLSVIYALLLVVTLAVLGAALYVKVNDFVETDAIGRLTRGRDLALTQVMHRDGPRGGDASRPSPPLYIGDYTSLTQDLSGSDVAVSLVDSQGTVIASARSTVSENAPQASALPTKWAETVAKGELDHWVVSGQGGGRWLILMKPTKLQSINGQVTQVFLEQAASLEAADGILNTLRFYLALGIVVGTILGVAAGLALTRVVLRPLDRMVGTAEAIADGDITRRVRMPAGRNEIARLGASFDHMVNRLAATLEAQRRFIADASHELRTPLTSLQGLSEMLLMGADQGDSRAVQRTVRGMHNELGRMGRLVNDLLTLSRLDSTAPASFVTVDASKLMAEVAAQMEPVAEGRGVCLDLRCSETPVLVRAEPDRLKQVVLNLVDNALRYSPQGSAVRMSVEADLATRQARLEVQDAGPGISPEDLPHIFDRFYRGDLSRARATGNSGLGLAIARAIVQAHGGMIEAQSSPGMGALFRVTLPAVG